MAEANCFFLNLLMRNLFSALTLCLRKLYHFRKFSSPWRSSVFTIVSRRQPKDIVWCVAVGNPSRFSTEVENLPHNHVRLISIVK